jgi:hypothetical protein
LSRSTCSAHDGVEQLVGHGHVVLVAVVGLGDVAQDVVLGQEATAVDEVATDKDPVGTQDLEVAEQGREGRVIDLVAMHVAKDHLDDVALAGLGARGRRHLDGLAAGRAGPLEGLDGLGVGLALGLELGLHLGELGLMVRGVGRLCDLAPVGGGFGFHNSLCRYTAVAPPHLVAGL